MLYEDRNAHGSAHLGIFGKSQSEINNLLKSEIKHIIDKYANHQIIIIDWMKEWDKELPSFESYNIDTEKRKIDFEYDFFKIKITESERLDYDQSIIYDVFELAVLLSMIEKGRELSLNERSGLSNCLDMIYKETDTPTLRDFEKTGDFYSIFENFDKMITGEKKFNSKNNIIFNVSNEFDRAVSLKIIYDIIKDNIKEGIYTSVFIPNLLMENDVPEIIIHHFESFFKRARKRGTDVVITGNSYKSSFESSYIRIIRNTDYLAFLRQSEDEERYLMNSFDCMSLYNGIFNLKDNEYVKITNKGCALGNIKEESEQKNETGITLKSSFGELQSYLNNNISLVDEEYIKRLFENITGLKGYFFVFKEDDENIKYDITANSKTICYINIEHRIFKGKNITISSPDEEYFLHLFHFDGSSCDVQLPKKARNMLMQKRRKEFLEGTILEHFRRYSHELHIIERCI